MAKRRHWTEEENKTLTGLYPDMLSSKVAKKLGRSISSVYGQASKLGLSKSDSFKLSEQSGRLTGEQGGATRFKKGRISHNKGVKMSEELRAKVAPTMFKKGNLPHNTKYDGVISTRVDTKSGKTYKYIRISKARWVHLHRVVWEKHNGKIPEGCIVVFKDGNQLNCDKGNLELITREALMLRNSIQNYPEEIISTIRAVSKLNKTIKDHEEQD